MTELQRVVKRALYAYVKPAVYATIQKLPEKGPERLIFFQDYFEDEEPVLAFDAYDEYARAPYEDLIGMKDQMKREQLIEWIKSPKTSVNRRRLYFTMLGVCGTQDDIPLLEELISSDSRKKRAGLDALIACYLNLKKADGVQLIEDRFLKNQEADYVDTLAAVSALRSQCISPRPALGGSLWLILTR